MFCFFYSNIRIGLKGNGTCELSSKAIRETVDLKPIGTRKDTDYDLYIKKLGCKLVLDKHRLHRPLYDDPVATSTETQRPLAFSSKPIDGHEVKPVYESHAYDHHASSNRPVYNNFKGDGVHHVSTLIAISPTRPDAGVGSSYHNSNPETVSAYRPPAPSGSYYYQPHPETVEVNSYDNYRPYAPNEPYRPFEYKPSRPIYAQEDYGDYRPMRRPEYYDTRPHAAPFKPQPSYGVEESRPTRPVYEEDARPPLKPIFGGAYGDDDGARPPFRPAYLNHPYEDDYYNSYRKPSRPYMDYYNQKHTVKRPYYSDDENYVRPGYDHNYPSRPHDPDNPNYYATNYVSYDNRYENKPKVHQKVDEVTLKPTAYGDYNNSNHQDVYGDAYSTRKPVDSYGSEGLSSVTKKPIITQSTSANGRPVTSIITELDNGKF